MKFTKFELQVITKAVVKFEDDNYAGEDDVWQQKINVLIAKLMIKNREVV